MPHFKIGDIVWAKMAGFPYWPSIIVQPPKDLRKPSTSSNKKYHCMYFFGSNNYGWIEASKLDEYELNRQKYIQSHDYAYFTEAVEEAENHIGKKKSIPNYKVAIKEKFKNKETRKRIKRREYYKFKKEVKLKKLPVGIKRDSFGNNRLEETEGSFNVETRDSFNVETRDSFNVALDTRKIVTSQLVFGVLGVGIIGSGVIKNLARSGHLVNIWNRTVSKCDRIVDELGAKFKKKVRTFYSARAMLQSSDIVFVCLSTQEVANRIFQNSFGINNAKDQILKDKGIVQMTTTGPEASKDIKSIIERKGGKYLEAQLQGSRNEAIEGNLLILAAGEESLFFDCQSCFKAIGKTVMYLGEAGYASKLNLILQTCRGVFLAGLAEALCLAERWNVPQRDFIHLLNFSDIASPYLRGKAHIIAERDFKNVEQPLKHLQRDLKLGLDLSDKAQEPLFLASTANEIFKHCRRLEYGSHDAAAIYMRNKH